LTYVQVWPQNNNQHALLPIHCQKNENRFLNMNRAAYYLKRSWPTKTNNRVGIPFLYSINLQQSTLTTEDTIINNYKQYVAYLYKWMMISDYKLTWYFADQVPCFFSTFQIFVCSFSSTIPIFILDNEKEMSKLM
jgi:hypothetical protein